MKNVSIYERLIVSFKRDPKSILISIFVIYGASWSILEPINSFIPSASEYFTGWNKFFILLITSSIIGIVRTISPLEISITYYNNIIKISFGDLFDYNGHKIIPVSRFFKEIDIVETSLQNLLIQTYIKSNEGLRGLDSYNFELASKLADKPHKKVYRKALAKEEDYYALGTTIDIKLNENEYLLFSLTKTEQKGMIPDDNCNVTILWRALEKLWEQAKEHSRGKPLNIPLLGSGVTGINLPPIKILELNLLAILNAIIENKTLTSNEIRIVLHPKYYEQIDLWKIKKNWSQLS